MTISPGSMNLCSTSVLLPTRNCVQSLDSSIESILTQSKSDFELIAVDGNSSDGTWERLQELQKMDPRIRLMKQQERGLVAALNEGIQAAKGTYIARADADDLCHPDRFKTQSEFLQEHPEVVLLASDFETIYLDGHRELNSIPTEHSALLRLLFKRNCIMHGSVMIRREGLLAVGGYSQAAQTSEDYELWFRLASVGRLASIPKVLSYYRITPGQLSTKDIRLRARNDFMMRLRVLMKGIVPVHYILLLGWPLFLFLIPGRVLSSLVARFGRSSRHPAPEVRE